MQQSSMQLPVSYRAWTWHTGTEPLGLVLNEIALNAPAAGQVLVRNAVIGLNPVDWKVLGSSGWQAGKVPGVDGAGVVVAIGDGVAADWLGQRVCYHQSLQQQGSYAEFTALPAQCLMRVPDALELTAAAAFPCPGLTAWRALDKIALQPQQAVLISGAGGAVGHYLVQLASAAGFAVTAMSHPRHWERLRGLGAQACIAGPLADGQSWQNPAHQPSGFYAVFDSINAAHAQRLAPALRANGHLVCIQGRVELWPCTPFGRSLSLHEVALGALHQHGDAADWQRLTAAGERMLEQIAQQQLHTETHVMRDFGMLPVLLEDLRCRNFSGKPLIQVGN